MAARSISVATTLTGTAAAFAFLYFFRPVLVPFVGAFVLAVLVSGLVRWIRDRSPKAPGWAVWLIAGLVVIIAASAALFVMGQGMVQMVAQGPALMERIDGLVQSVGQSFHLKEQLHLTNLIGSVSRSPDCGLRPFKRSGAGVRRSSDDRLFRLLAGRERMNSKLDHFEGSQGRAKTIRRIVVKIAQDLFTYIWVQTITGTILTVAAAAVMLAVGLNNVLFWCVVFFLLTFIPNIGVTVGSVAPALFALLQFPTLWQAITIFVVVQVVATIVGNMIYPRLQAEKQNIDPLATILSLSFWTLLWGLAGAFLAVPLTLMTMTVFAQFESTKWVAALLSNDGKIDS